MSEQYLTIPHLRTKDLARIFGKIKVSAEHFYKKSPCWDWLASKKKGYGVTNIRSKYITLHRVMYAWLVGPLPVGHGNGIPVLDHLCRRPECCNPVHLELVSDKINLMRGTSPSAICAQKTECKNGHSLSGDNLYTKPSGARCCRECRSQAAERLKQRRLTDPDYLEHYRRLAREGAKRRLSDPSARKRHNEINSRCKKERTRSRKAATLPSSALPSIHCGELP